MADTHFTPAPWRAVCLYDVSDSTYIEPTAFAYRGDIDMEHLPAIDSDWQREIWANANLKAAAPELYAALESALPLLDDAAIFDAASAALQKARGEHT